MFRGDFTQSDLFDFDCGLQYMLFRNIPIVYFFANDPSCFTAPPNSCNQYFLQHTIFKSFIFYNFIVIVYFFYLY